MHVPGGAPAFFDFDGDGYLDLLIGTSTGKIVAYTQTPMPGIEIAVNVTAEADIGATITGSNSADFIDAVSSARGQPFATDNDDTILGRGGRDVIYGLGGNDIIDGGAGRDTIYGGDGDDIIRILGNQGRGDIIDGGAGTDTIEIIGNGNVTLEGFNATAWSIEAWLGNGKEVRGTGGNNLFDFSGLQSVSGIAGVKAGGGNDILIGSGFTDRLDGGAGNDMLHGGDGDDTLNGGNGHDVLDGGDGDDTLNGGNGNDVLDGGDGADTLNGGNGHDVLSGGDGDDTLNGGNGNDTVLGGHGDDIIQISGAQAKRDVINGGTGSDTIEVIGRGAVKLAGFDAAASSIEVWLGNGKAVNGTSANDLFDFSGLTSMTGINWVNGGAGNDTLIGSSFADELRGSAGDDRLDGGAGDDILHGGAGRDTFVFGDGYGADIVLDYQAGRDIFDLTGVAGANSFADLHLTQIDARTVLIDFDGIPGGDTLTIQKTTIATLTANQGDFLF